MADGCAASGWAADEAGLRWYGVISHREAIYPIFCSIRTGTGSVGEGGPEVPYYPDVAGAPQNSIIGGASLWVMGGKKPEEYKGVAKFFTFLSQTDLQEKLHEETGYLQSPRPPMRRPRHPAFMKRTRDAKSRSCK
jgi:hypothetical protein